MVVLRHTGSQFENGLAYLAYHRSSEVDWDNEACIGWFPYEHSSGERLETPVREVTSARRDADDV